MSIFQGDPKLFLDKDGVSLVFKDGQPVMDNGLENYVLIALGTEIGWVGNALLDGEEIGSNFEKVASGPITIDTLDGLRVEAEAALDSPLLGEVGVVSNNPINSKTDTAISIKPPGDLDSLDFVLSKDGLSWSFQRNDPAYLRV